MTSETTPGAAKMKRRRRWRYPLAVVGLGLVVAAGTVGWQAIQAARIRAELRQFIAELDRDEPGWQIDALESARAVVPDAENNVPAILRAAKAIPRLTSPEWIRLEAMLTSLSPQVRLTDEQYKYCIDDLESMERAVSELETIARLPRGHCTIVHQGDGVSDRLILANDSSRIPLPVNLMVLVATHDGDLTTALRMCTVGLHIAAAIGDESFVVCQNCRARHVNTALDGLERVLGHGELPEVELQSFQRQLVAETAFDPWLIGLRGERAWQHQTLEAVSQGRVSKSEFKQFAHSTYSRQTNWTEKVRDWLDDRLPLNVDEAHTWMLQRKTRLLQDTVALPWHRRAVAVAA